MQYPQDSNVLHQAYEYPLKAHSSKHNCPSDVTSVKKSLLFFFQNTKIQYKNVTNNSYSNSKFSYIPKKKKRIPKTAKRLP